MVVNPCAAIVALHRYPLPSAHKNNRTTLATPPGFRDRQSPWQIKPACFLQPIALY
jgi:hypothetical protein